MQACCIKDRESCKTVLKPTTLTTQSMENAQRQILMIYTKEAKHHMCSSTRL